VGILSSPGNTRNSYVFSGMGDSLILVSGMSHLVFPLIGDRMVCMPC
jgi:hypothetical protein